MFHGLMNNPVFIGILFSAFPRSLIVNLGI